MSMQGWEGLGSKAVLPFLRGAFRAFYGRVVASE